MTSCLDLLLHVPITIVYSKLEGEKVTDNVYLWKNIMLKSLNVGHSQSTQLALNSITMLEHWFNALPIHATIDLYRDILPRLSDFLHIDDDHANKHGGGKKKSQHQQQQQEDYQFQEMLKAGNDKGQLDRKDIAAKVLDLLGKIGGHAHSIINNQQSKEHEKENFIKWDPERRLKFTVPLYTTKVDIYLDACLPKLVDLALNA